MRVWSLTVKRWQLPVQIHSTLFVVSPGFVFVVLVTVSVTNFVSGFDAFFIFVVGTSKSAMSRQELSSS